MIAKKAITLVEMSVAIILAFVLLASLLNIFSSGIKESTNALTHQDNMETANILMSQIEYDLNKATEIKNPTRNLDSDSGEWLFTSKSSLGDMSFSYDYIPDVGVHRVVKGNNNYREDNFFANGHPVNLKFTHIVVNSDDKNDNIVQDKHAMWVELVVGSQKNDVASFSIKRLVVLNQ